MSIVELRVELPAYAHSFTVEALSSSTIADVKQEISRICTGGPKVDGQRLIWRGRYLNDGEKVEEIWKSPDEPRILLLAVHPSAWSASPPHDTKPTSTTANSVSSIPSSSSSNMGLSEPTSGSSGTIEPHWFSPGGPHPLQFVMIKHSQAMEVLRGLATSDSPVMHNKGLRILSVSNVERHGYIWPDILDKEFPPITLGGLIYDIKTIDGEDYLSLRQPAGSPTPAQTHALNVLTYTFSLLQLIPNSELIPTPTVHTLQGVSIPLHVNDLLQQLGLGHLEVAGADALPVEVQVQQQRANPNPVLPPVREIALRPFVAPLMLLLLRTTLLLYFVAPTRKPFFVFLVLIWMLYEIWRPIQNVLMRIHRAAGDPRQENAAAPPQPQPANNVGRGEPIPNQQPQDPNIAGLQFGFGFGFNNIDEQILHTTANQNTVQEEQVLNAIDGPNTEEPGFLHKAMTLFSLMVTTLHPAVWNRRRDALRPREGKIRTEANMRNALSNEEDEGSDSRQHIRAELVAQHTRRPRWVRDYIERVVAAEWVDDSD